MIILVKKTMYFKGRILYASGKLVRRHLWSSLRHAVLVPRQVGVVVELPEEGEARRGGAQDILDLSLPPEPDSGQRGEHCSGGQGTVN